MGEVSSAILAVLAVSSSFATGPFDVLTECPSIDIPYETVHIPHEYDCTKFYKCWHGKKVIQDCPLYNEDRRLYYDPERQVCNWPWEVTCWSQQKECAADQFLHPHPYNCDLYYECENGEKVLKACGQGQRFDSELMTCMPEEVANCNIYLDRCPTGEFLGTVLLPHECKCSQYYECADGELIEKYCPSGEEFDINSRECVLDKEATCNPGSEQSPVTIPCPASGIKHIPHATDCSLYYECVNGVRTEKKCDHGLSFDESKGMCTWPPSSDCTTTAYGESSVTAPLAFGEFEKIPAFECPPKGSKGIARSPHHCSCSKYYTCMDGEMIVENCPIGMEYDYISQACDYPANAICIHRKSKPTTASLSRATSSRECSSTGKEKLPHESKCRLYYQCVRGKKQLRSCYEGHYFNEVIEACDLPIHTNCVDGSTSPTTPQGPDECPSSNCEGIVRLPDSGNCSLYYKCEDGMKVQKECPKDLYFDPTEQICDWPENVNCALKELCVTGEKSHHECQCDLYYECKDGRRTVQSCPKGKYFDYRRKVCDGRESVVCFPDNGGTNRCIGSCSTNDSAENLPHEDCRKYCECNGGVSRAIDCPKNKYYDSIRRTCDWPENVPNLKCDPFPCTADSTGQKLPHECYCDRYYVCLNGTKTREHCEDGLYFDYEKQVCVQPGEAHCFAKQTIRETEDEKQCSGSCSTDDSTSSFPHKDCKKYCKCSGGKRKVYRCPENLYYDTEKQMCNWPENVKNLGCDPFPCSYGSTRLNALPHECNCNIYYTCYNGTKSRESCDVGYQFDYVERICVKSGKAHCYKKPSDAEAAEADNCIGTCPIGDSTNAHIRLAHEDCSKFCVCHVGAAYVLTCSEGLHYNEARQTCTQPDAAQCQRSNTEEFGTL